jgi:hypothetical protein
MDKLACRTYAIIWFLYGALCLVFSAYLLFWAGFIDSFEAPPSWQPVLPGTFLIVVPFTTIVIAVGVFAYFRYLLAMIVGYLVWMFPIAAVVLYDQLPFNKQTYWLVNQVTDLLHIWMFWNRCCKSVFDGYRGNFTAPRASPSLLGTFGSWR